MEPDKQVSNQPQTGSSPATAPKLPTPVAPPVTAENSMPSSPVPPIEPNQQPPIMPTAQPGQPQSPAPVATAIGEIAAQPTVDNTAAQATPIADAQTQLPADPGSQSPIQTDTSVPTSGQQYDESKTIKLPIQTSFLPAIVIGALVVLLLLAVVAYAFL